MTHPTLFDNAPGHVRHDAMDTSRDAAEGIEPVSGRLRKRVYETIRDRWDGATCDMVEFLTDLTHQTASARIRDLVLSGHLVDSGRRRKTRSGRAAAVWVVRA